MCLHPGVRRSGQRPQLQGEHDGILRRHKIAFDESILSETDGSGRKDGHADQRSD